MILGDHSTRRQNHIVWNRKLLREVIHTLLPEFEEVEDDCTKFLAPAEEMLFKELDSMRDHLLSMEFLTAIGNSLLTGCR